MKTILLLLATQVATPPAPPELFDEYVRLNMLVAACESHAPPRLVVLLEDINRDLPPELRAQVDQARDAGRYELRLTRRDCHAMLPTAIARARL